MYYFEGKDYSKDPSSEDQKSFDRLLEGQLAEFQKAAGEGRALRHKAGVRFCLIHYQLVWGEVPPTELGHSRSCGMGLFRHTKAGNDPIISF